MTAHTVFPRQHVSRRRSRSFLLLPFLFLLVPLLAAASFVAYVLWPNWADAPVASDAPALPVTVAGVLFEVPPASIRVAMQRNPGPHERLDLAFLWPSLTPPPPGAEDDGYSRNAIDSGNPGAANLQTGSAGASGRLFVTIEPLGSLPPPAERLRSIYPRYVGPQASVGANGLAKMPFRTGTPYADEDLIFDAADSDRFYALCTRRGPLPATCLQERALGPVDVILRFRRSWLNTDWRSVAAGLDRLIVQLHPQSR
ncbi:MAG: hypothetical protein WBF58_20715 [Xanthobacteraceae bacterium]